jgi:hypothetical protein
MQERISTALFHGVKAGAGGNPVDVTKGPIRLEYGWKVNPQKGEELALAFAMGQLFNLLKSWRLRLDSDRTFRLVIIQLCRKVGDKFGSARQQSILTSTRFAPKPTKK